MSDNVLPSPRRSTGRTHVARALWHIAPGNSQLQIETLLPLRDGLARVTTLYSGISRGTERLVHSGAVPRSQWQTMRAPMQAGEFSFPVKYGYSTVGRVTDGDRDHVGRTVFCLHPHQDYFDAPLTALATIPDHIPPRRATLAANMETALNAAWDAAIAPGDRIAVVGAGVVGLLTARIAARMPGTDVTIIDTNTNRSDLAAAMGARFATPGDAPGQCDCIFHTSATAAGLQTAIGAAATEATIVEMSWYGDQAITVSLGGSVHSGRLRIVSSQVGSVAPSHRARWTYARRLQKAVDLLDDEVLDMLVTDTISFEDAPNVLPRILDKDYLDLPPVIRYQAAADT